MRTEMAQLFEELVPPAGPASTVAGELVRAYSRLHRRYYNDGDKVGIGYGNETCNCAARFIGKAFDSIPLQVRVSALWQIDSDSFYETLLEELEAEVYHYIAARPELKTEPNTLDMLDFSIPEDFENDEEDEED